MPRWVPLWLLAQYILLLVDLGDRLRDTSVSCSPRQPMAYKEEFGDLRSSYDLDTETGQQSRPAIKHDIFVKITRKNSPGRLQARSDDDDRRLWWWHFRTTIPLGHQAVKLALTNISPDRLQARHDDGPDRPQARLLNAGPLVGQEYKDSGMIVVFRHEKSADLV
ncbi:hypothetical protein F5J12DRAFT_889746 [Pisolithus orientalis]|uniref:uncharacterized protein n=1 Tax=Pisolithus orientalis TaxID=936130 RepID=UPI00222421D9|nr:uncharacterized protein F5J12DRAFT_889746 [Pisolithus orientalis]KAI6025836.1 hypothetical protein F5J12DRAFT_889746 [Pisolithus orientalis]